MVVAACLLSVWATASPALAADDQWELWLYEGGWSRHTEKDKWIEVNPDIYKDREGRPINYVEVKRTKEYVELYDADRKIAVRLYDSTEEHRSGEGAWETGYKGRWKK
jgi:hypothetical protein